MNDRFAQTNNVEQYSRLFTYKNESDMGGKKSENRKYTQAHVVGREAIERNKDRRVT